jgi:hypothetical protein
MASLVQWLLAIPHLMIAYALRSLRQVFDSDQLFHGAVYRADTRGLFDAIAMTHRYEC